MAYGGSKMRVAGQRVSRGQGGRPGSCGSALCRVAWRPFEGQGHEGHASEKGGKRPEPQRFKGLGEMDAQQLWETTMDPETRTLLRVDIEDATTADRLFSILMGTDVQERKDFIQQNAKDVENLDV